MCADLILACQDSQCVPDRGKHSWGQKLSVGDPCGCQKPVWGWRWKRHKVETLLETQEQGEANAPVTTILLNQHISQGI